MGTEKQNEANKKNAQFSTGPKTLGGKRRSSRNSLKHGMCAKVHVTDEDKAEFIERLELWNGSLAPDGDPVKEDLIYLAVRCYHRTDRALRADEAEALRRVENSELFRHREIHNQVKEYLKEMKTDPASAVKGLQSSLIGCDWLIETLKGLHEALDLVRWKDAYHSTARAILGHDNTDPLRDVRDIDHWNDLVVDYCKRREDFGKPFLWMEWQAIQLTVEGLIKACDRENNLILEKHKVAEEVGNKYVNLMAAEIERLKTVREALIPLDELDKAAAKERALVDTSPEGRLRLRYIGEAQRDMYKALNEIAKLDIFTTKIADRVSRNEANSAESSPPTHE